MNDFYLGGPPDRLTRRQKLRREILGGICFAISLGFVGALILFGGLS